MALLERQRFVTTSRVFPTSHLAPPSKGKAAGKAASTGTDCSDILKFFFLKLNVLCFFILCYHDVYFATLFYANFLKVVF